MDSFHLEILSPESVSYSGECVSLVMPIDDGMLGIMAHHSPLTAAIMDGEVNITLPDGEKRIYAVTRGMVNVGENGVRLLCESAISPDEIDAEKERILAQEAALELKKKQSHKDFVMWQLSFNKAISNLKIKNKEIRETK